MQNRANSKIVFWIVLALASLSANLWFFMNRGAGGGESAVAVEEVWVCPMHPQVVSDHAIDCPICGMKLVKRQASLVDAGLDSLIKSVSLAPTQVLLANVSTGTPEFKSIKKSLKLPAVIRARESLSWSMTAKTMGKVEKIYVGDAGQKVKKGDPLYDFYTPEIAAAANEFLHVRERFLEDSLGLMIEAARGKLLGMGLDLEHLTEIERLSQAFDIFTFRAPRDGIVMAKMVAEGDWVMPGMKVLEIVDLTEVWVDAALLENDARLASAGVAVLVVTPFGDKIQGKIESIAPEAEMMSHAIVPRISIANPGMRLRPGMLATVEIASATSEMAMVLPEDAILTTGAGNFVWVEVAAGHFSPRKVITGIRIDGTVEILDGLKSTERVAVTGAYLIDSDAILRNLNLHPDEVSPVAVSSKEHPKGKYYCPMHLEVTSETEGRCHICNMFLVPREG